MGLSVQNPDADCLGGSGGQCIGINFPNVEAFEHYGYDPRMDESFKPEEGASDEIFHWFKNFPTKANILKKRKQKDVAK